MSLHTPSLWLVDRDDYTIAVERSPGEFLSIAQLQPMDHNGLKFFVGPETWANAYLMRAAPQMLKALEDLLAGVGPDTPSDTLDQVRAAIAAAHGLGHL